MSHHIQGFRKLYRTVIKKQATPDAESATPKKDDKVKVEVHYSAAEDEDNLQTALSPLRGALRFVYK